MSQASPKIISIDIEKVFPNSEDQERVYPIVDYLDDEGLNKLHLYLRTKLVLKVIGHDRRNPDVKNLQERLEKQWKLLEQAIKKIPATKAQGKNGTKADLRLEAISTLKNTISQVKH